MVDLLIWFQSWNLLHIRWLGGPQYVPICGFALLGGLMELPRVQYVIIYDLIIKQFFSYESNNATPFAAVTQIDYHLLIILNLFIFCIVFKTHRPFEDLVEVLINYTILFFLLLIVDYGVILLKLLIWLLSAEAFDRHKNTIRNWALFS